GQPVGGLAHDLDAVIDLQQLAQALPHQLLVVHQQHPHRAHAGSSARSSTPLAALPLVSVPPSASTRSVSELSPNPGPRSSPLPSSATTSTTFSFSNVSVPRTESASACRRALVSPSWSTR